MVGSMSDPTWLVLEAALKELDVLIEEFLSAESLTYLVDSQSRSTVVVLSAVIGYVRFVRVMAEHGLLDRFRPLAELAAETREQVGQLRLGLEQMRRGREVN